MHSTEQKGPAMARNDLAPTPLATAEEVATYLRTTSQVLATKRYLGQGPPYKKLGSRVFYDWADVLAWVEVNTVQRIG